MSNENEKDDFEIEVGGFGVPKAPTPKPKQPENLPDWAKITSSIADEETEDAGEIFDEKRPPAYVPPKKGFGEPIESLSDEDLFLDTDDTPPAVAKTEQVYSYEEEEIEEDTPIVVPPAPKSRTVNTATPVSRSVPEYEEDEIEEEPVYEAPKKSSFKKLPDAKQKKTKPVKSAKAVKKSILSGVMGKESDIMAPKGRMAGNRWKLIGLRTAVWGTLGIIMLSGTLTIFGPKGPSISSITQQVLLGINRNNFPLEAGQQVAARFAKEYLTISVADSSIRQDILKTYIIGSGSEETQISSFNATRDQKVLGEPILAMPAELISDSHVVYTFAVQIYQPAMKETEDTPALPATTPSWVYIAIPLAADEDGSIGVAGMPAFVPQPKIAEKAEAITFTEDSDAARDSRSQIEKFLLHWAASDEVSLKPYLVDNVSSPSAQAGLGGTLSFVALDRLSVEAFPTDYVQDPEVAPTCSAPDYALPCRDAYATVKWNSQGIEVTNRYRLVVLFDGQNWRVIDIRGANFEKVGG
jgi:hypothetical protein